MKALARVNTAVERSGLIGDALPPGCIVKCWGDERIIERDGKVLTRFFVGEALDASSVAEFLHEKIAHLYFCDACGTDLEDGTTCASCTEKQLAEILDLRSSF